MFRLVHAIRAPWLCNVESEWKQSGWKCSQSGYHTHVAPKHIENTPRALGSVGAPLCLFCNSLGWQGCYMLTLQALTYTEGSRIRTGMLIWNNATGTLSSSAIPLNWGEVRTSASRGQQEQWTAPNTWSFALDLMEYLHSIFKLLSWLGMIVQWRKTPANWKRSSSVYDYSWWTLSGAWKTRTFGWERKWNFVFKVLWKKSTYRIYIRLVFYTGGIPPTDKKLSTMIMQIHIRTSSKHWYIESKKLKSWIILISQICQDRIQRFFGQSSFLMLVISLV